MPGQGRGCGCRGWRARRTGRGRRRTCRQRRQQGNSRDARTHVHKTQYPTTRFASQQVMQVDRAAENGTYPVRHAARCGGHRLRRRARSGMLDRARAGNRDRTDHREQYARRRRPSTLRPRRGTPRRRDAEARWERVAPRTTGGSADCRSCQQFLRLARAWPLHIDPCRGPVRDAAHRSSRQARQHRRDLPAQIAAHLLTAPLGPLRHVRPRLAHVTLPPGTYPEEDTRVPSWAEVPVLDGSRLMCARRQPGRLLTILSNSGSDGPLLPWGVFSQCVTTVYRRRPSVRSARSVP